MGQGTVLIIESMQVILLGLTLGVAVRLVVDGVKKDRGEK